MVSRVHHFYLVRPFTASLGRQALAALISRSPGTPQRSQTATPSVQTSTPTLAENGPEQETIVSNSPLLLAQVGHIIKSHDNHMIYPID